MGAANAKEIPGLTAFAVRTIATSKLTAEVSEESHDFRIELD